ncbi:MAG: SGNH/GDSL hydrolase family protein [Bacteroidota bacterium]
MKVAPLVKRILLRMISTLFGLIIGLFLAEICCRFFSFGLEAFAVKKTDSFVSIGYSGYLQPAENQFVWYELKPNLNASFKLNPLHTNSRGLRDKEYALKKPPGTYRIAVIGDSFVFGDGVEIEETFHSIAEEKLNMLSDSINFEFLNFGLGGYDLLNYLGVIENKALAYKPDLILIGFCGNNDDDLPEARQYSERFSGYKFEKYSWFIRHFQVLRTVGNHISIRRRLENEAKNKKHEAKQEHMRQFFAEYACLRDMHQVPMMVYYLSMADAAESKAKYVAELCQNNGFHFLDSSPEVNKIKDISQYWFHRSDHHPNADMHALYADILLKSFVEVKHELALFP